MSPPGPSAASPWIRVTWIAFGLALIAAAGFVAFASRLISLGLDRPIYLIVLFPLGLAAAGFLFGALRSTARLSGTQYGMKLELTGPVVVFVLVIAGGYLLTRPDESFPLVVRVDGPNGEIIKSGELTIDFGADRKGPIPITERGEAYFPVVPSAFIGKDVQIRADVPGYSLSGSASRRLDASKVLRLTLDPRPVAPRKIAGLIEDRRHEKVPGARVTVPTLRLHADSNEDGYFELLVTAASPSEATLRVEKTGFHTLEQNVSVGNTELTLTLGR